VRSELTDLLGIEHPIIQAPMAGGPSTVDLVVAVSEAGALGSIAGAILSPNALRAEIRAVRARTRRPFAVNLFAPLETHEPEPGVVEAVDEFLAPYRERLGVGRGEPRPPSWDPLDQLAVVVEERVPVFSFTLGIPPLEAFEDTVLLGTATTAVEAVALEQAGVAAVVLQGAEAGGHRGTFLTSFEDGLVPLAELIAEAAARCSVPLVATGGIVDGAGIADALRAGAAGVQLGTAFLFANESGADRAWKDALRRNDTFVSAAYSGRPARGARTPFLEELTAGVQPAPFGTQRALLDPFRNHDEYGWYLGGTGAARARELPAAELVRVLVEETQAALSRLSRSR
jgi:nitronate monooxygenase